MTTNETLLTESRVSSAQEPTNKRRRALIGGALAALLASPKMIKAEETETAGINNPFILLLKGIYQPVAHGPNLGLSGVNLSDGTYSVTKIYSIFGAPGSSDQDNAMGKFYVQFNGNLCAYDLPGGAIEMQFTGQNIAEHPDGKGGFFFAGTYELTILDATGIYRMFKGGHNHMVARTHQLINGNLDEFCFCIISQYQFP